MSRAGNQAGAIALDGGNGVFRTGLGAVVVIAFVLTLAGCAAMSALTFKPAEGSGKTSGTVDIMATKVEVRGTNANASKSDAALLQLDQNAQTALETCRRLPFAEAALLSLVVPTMAKYTFDMLMDNLARNIEALKESAQPPAYSAMLVQSPGTLAETRCLILTRSVSDGGTPLTMVLRLERKGDAAFVLTPIYASTRTAVAVTAPGDGFKPAKISLAGAVVVRGLGKSRGGYSTVEVIAQGTFKVTSLTLDGHDACPERCSGSDLLAYPNKGASDWSSVTISIAEQGNVGIPLDPALAEIKALKESMGPTLRDLVKEIVN